MKRKALALVLCLAVILSVTLPGTLAVSTASDSTEAKVGIAPDSSQSTPNDTTGQATDGNSEAVNPPVSGSTSDNTPNGTVTDSTTTEGTTTEGTTTDSTTTEGTTTEGTTTEGTTTEGTTTEGTTTDDNQQPAVGEPVCTCGAEGETHKEDCPRYKAPEVEEAPEGTPPESWGSSSLAGAVPFTNVAPLVSSGIATPFLLRSAGNSRAVNSRAAGDQDSGVVLNKTAKVNANGGFDITLEAYATGEQTTIVNTTVADIVLVLDVSGSMKYGMTTDDYENMYIPSGYNAKLYESYTFLQNGEYIRVDYSGGPERNDYGWWTVENNAYVTKVTPKTGANDTNANHVQLLKIKSGQTKLDYLRTAVNNFISSSLDTSPDSQIALVSFSGKYDGSTPPKVTTVSGFSSNSKELQTAVNGLTAAGATYSDEGMKRAAELINANTNDHKKVVIMFTDGDPSETIPFSDTVANGAISASHDLKQNGVTVYTIGVFAGANGSLSSVSLSNTNKYMHYVSSNFPNATSLDYGGDRNTELSGADSYYLSATSSADLYKIFQKISQQVGGATNTTLGTSTVVKDIIAPSFAVPANASDVKLYTANCTGAGLTFGNRTPAAGVTATITGDTLDVTGFDFSNNWCGNHSGTYSGKKLIIEFTVSPKEGFLGGNNVPTNGETSGLYSNGTPVGLFEVPTVNVPIADITITAEDKNVYLTQVPTEEQLKSGVTIKCGDVDITDSSQLEDWQKAYVNIESSFTNSTDFNATTDGTYTVTANVSPITTGDSSKPGTVATQKIGTETKNIHVFKPELTYKDSDVYYGDDEPTSYESNLTKTEWKHGDTTSTYSGVTMIGTAPTLSLTYDPGAGVVDGKIAVKTDIPVDVTVKIGTTDVTDKTTFVHTDCTDKTCTVPSGKEFLLHVKTCTLTIIKAAGTNTTIGNDEYFVFTVYKDNDKFTEVTIKGTGSVTISELPVGTYTIEEDTSVAWRYDKQPTITGNGVLSSTNPNGTLTCTNTKNTDNWINDFTRVINTYGITEGEIK